MDSILCRLYYESCQRNGKEMVAEDLRAIITQANMICLEYAMLQRLLRGEHILKDFTAENGFDYEPNGMASAAELINKNFP